MASSKVGLNGPRGELSPALCTSHARTIPDSVAHHARTRLYLMAHEFSIKGCTLWPTSSRTRCASVAHHSRIKSGSDSAVILGDALVSLAHFWTTTVRRGFSSVGTSKSPFVRA